MGIDEIAIDGSFRIVKYYRNSYADGKLKAVMLFYPTKSVFSNGDEKTQLVFWQLKDVAKYDLNPGDMFEFHNKVYRKMDGSAGLRLETEIRKYENL